MSSEHQAELDILKFTRRALGHACQAHKDERDNGGQVYTDYIELHQALRMITGMIEHKEKDLGPGCTFCNGTGLSGFAP